MRASQTKNKLIMKKIFTSWCLLLCAFFAAAEAFAESTPLATEEVPDGYYFIKGRSDSYGTKAYWTIGASNKMALTTTADDDAKWYISKQTTSDNKNVYAIKHVSKSMYIGYGPSVVPNANYTLGQTSYYIFYDATNGYTFGGTWNTAAIGPKDTSDTADNWKRGSNVGTGLQYVDLIPTSAPGLFELETDNPCFLRLGDGGTWSAGGYIYSVDDEVKMQGQNPDLSKESAVWTIKGDATNGYKFINVPSGKALGVVVSALESSDKTSVALYDAETPGDGVSILWDAAKSTAISGESGFYLAVHGHPTYRMNDNNNGSTAERSIYFWKSANAASGSTFRILNSIDITLSTVSTSDEATNGKAYATLYYPFAYTLSEGVTAYTATLDADNGRANTAQVTGVVAANTGIIAESSTTSATLTLANAPETSDKGNLTGTLSAISDIAEDASANYLVLGINNQTLGFYLPKVGGSIAANRAYFDISNLSASVAAGLKLNFGNAVTGLDTIATDISAPNTNGTIYDLSGRRVTSPVKGGIYICGGKKMVVK